MSEADAFYRQHYTQIDSELAAEIRREVFEEDIGQESWRTAAEQTEIADLTRLTPEAGSSMWPAERAALHWRWSTAPAAGSSVSTSRSRV